MSVYDTQTVQYALEFSPAIAEIGLTDYLTTLHAQARAGLDREMDARALTRVSFPRVTFTVSAVAEGTHRQPHTEQ